MASPGERYMIVDETRKMTFDALAGDAVVLLQRESFEETKFLPEASLATWRSPDVSGR